MRLRLEDDLWWSAMLHLPTWAGYQSRFGRYASIDTSEPSDGKAKFVFAPDGRAPGPMRAEELQLVSWFEDHEPAVSAAVKAAIIGWHPAPVTPWLASEADLKLNCGLYSVNVHQLVHGDLPYIGYELGCNWEEEHGCGVLMHGSRLVEIGDADVALHLWRAQQDADALKQGQPET